MFCLNDLPHLHSRLLSTVFNVLGPNAYVLGQVSIAGIVVFGPCFLMGAFFPMTIRAFEDASRERATPEQGVGFLYSLNTVGAIGGSLGAAFLLIPRLGIWKTILVASLGNTLLGAFLLLREKEFPWRRRLAIVASGLALLGVVAFLIPDWDARRLNQGLYLESVTNEVGANEDGLDEERLQAEKLVFYRDGINATISVYTADGKADLRVSGKSDASNSRVDLYTQLLAGQTPMMLAGEPRRVALIGYGSGMSARSILSHPTVETLDIIEIEQAIIDTSPYFQHHRELSGGEVGLRGAG